MVSVKERARIAAQIEQITKRIERQKDAITRLLVIQMECVAALGEIANMDPMEDAFAACQDRAKIALERIEEMAAATREVAERLLRGEEPTTDEEDDDESQH